MYAIGGARYLKLVEHGHKRQGTGDNNFLCGPNIDFVQLLCALKRRCRVQGQSRHTEAAALLVFGRSMKASNLHVFYLET